MITGAGAFHRFGLGPRPGDLGPDARERLIAELDEPGIAEVRDPALRDTGTALSALIEERAAIRLGQATAPPRDQRPPQLTTQVYRNEIAARIAKVQSVATGFVERLVAFWTNHFAIEAAAGQTPRLLVGVFEREAIRPHVLGRFRDMLHAATKHPAMLSYLDNAQSVGPNSAFGRARGRGLNENHARELLELHTIGVDGGYTQDDVIALARILTGWSFIAGIDGPASIGAFQFRRFAHEPGEHVVRGITYPAGGIEQGEAVLDALAADPATARHIATKLVRHFLAAESPALVDRLAAAFSDSEGDLKEVAAALIRSDEAWNDPTKLKLPQEYVWSAIRALGLMPRPQDVADATRALGQPIWYPPSPEGFPDEAENWLAPDALTTRLDIAEVAAAAANPDIPPPELLPLVLGPEVSLDTTIAVQRAESVTQALALLLMSPEFQRR